MSSAAPQPYSPKLDYPHPHPPRGEKSQEEIKLFVFCSLMAPFAITGKCRRMKAEWEWEAWDTTLWGQNSRLTWAAVFFHSRLPPPRPHRQLCLVSGQWPRGRAPNALAGAQGACKNGAYSTACLQMLAKTVLQAKEGAESRKGR